ncbi:MAG: SAM-dependent DNA methyltransferase, partial [Candidatus Cloacimonetes bacterium]|nr:SAM-dependent DNA methyltransferase [Candidatus Cloacimonadota bacterium]
TNLPEDYKSEIKSLFVKYQLVTDLRKVLWGNSRIDIAALVLSKAIIEHLTDDGLATMFLPSSLFMNEGAHDDFRKLATSSAIFSVEELHDLTALDIFQGVGTRYCLTKLRKGRRTLFPVDYIIHTPNNDTQTKKARPVTEDYSCWRIGDKSRFDKITVPKASMPRQGVNTCGANSVFFFSDAEFLDNDTVRLTGKNSIALLEREVVFPLITGKNFGDNNQIPNKYVFLPYNKITKRILSQCELEMMYPLAWKYLLSNMDGLISRKGMMIRLQIAKGFWWALLGIGDYTFRQFKIVWESYGKDRFSPEIFEGDWIPNQSLQAYMSFNSRSQAEDILSELTESNIEDALKASLNAGTGSWAQPGKVKMFLNLVDNMEQSSLVQVS